MMVDAGHVVDGNSYETMERKQAVAFDFWLLTPTAR